jgi:zinc transporter ZupT
MRRRQLKWLWQRLKQLVTMKLSREALLMKLGAAQAKTPAAWRLVKIELAEKDTTFTYGLDRHKLRQIRRREGRYLLRTNLSDSDPVRLWSYYLQLVSVEAFKTLITLHNFPEGLAVGVGFGGGDFANGLAIATGIGLQNAPEGLVVAFALLTLRYSPWAAWLVALATGLVEPVGGLIGAGVVLIAGSFLPWMGFAAGAMLFVVSHEIIPESHRKGHEMPATLGVLLGFIVMMMLDTTLS